MTGDKRFQQISVGSKVSVAELGMGQRQTAGEQSLAREIICQSVLGTPAISPSPSPCRAPTAAYKGRILYSWMDFS